VYEQHPETGRLAFGDGVHGNVPPELAVITIFYESGPHDGFVDFYREVKEALLLGELPPGRVRLQRLLGTATLRPPRRDRPYLVTEAVGRWRRFRQFYRRIDRTRFPHLAYPPLFVDVGGVPAEEQPELRIDGYVGERLLLSRRFSADPPRTSSRSWRTTTSSRVTAATRSWAPGRSPSACAEPRPCWRSWTASARSGRRDAGSVDVTGSAEGDVRRGGMWYKLCPYWAGMVGTCLR
jgi:hypothetical protein